MIDEAPPRALRGDFGRWCWEMRHVCGYSWQFVVSRAGNSEIFVRRCAAAYERRASRAADRD